jgi:competence protein ComEA
MKKIIALLLLSVSFIFAAINLQTASKDELMSIKGIGPMKADKIMKYRISNVINSADDLQKIKGFGPVIISNVKADKTVSKKKIMKANKREKKEASNK